MNCPDDEVLELFADGELDDAQWADVERHLDICEACRERLVAIRRADTAAREALAALKSSAPVLRLAAAKKKARLLSMPLAVAAAAAVIAVATGAIWMARYARPEALKPAVVVKNLPTATPRTASSQPQVEPEALTEEVTPLPSSPEEYAKRAAEARRLAIMPVDSLPAWKVDELRRIVAERRGFVPQQDG